MMIKYTITLTDEKLYNLICGLIQLVTKKTLVQITSENKDVHCGVADINTPQR